MAFTTQASKDGQMVTTTRLGPTVTVAKARALIKEGWDVHVTGADGRQHGPAQLDALLTFDHITPPNLS